MLRSTVEVRWRGRPVNAFVPVCLDELDPPSAAAIRAAALAEGALTAVDDRLRSGLEVPGRLLLWVEGVASSRIEEIHAPAAEIAVAAADSALGGAAGWIAGNLRSIDAALRQTGELRAEDLWAWHRLLMAHSGLDASLIGAWRDRLGWIGGPSPHRAAHVPPPPDLIGGGNGQPAGLRPQDRRRFGHPGGHRPRPVRDHPPVRRRQRPHRPHPHRLDPASPAGPAPTATSVRHLPARPRGLPVRPHPLPGGGPEPWVRWFAGAIGKTARSTESILTAILELAGGWPNRLVGVRADAAARKLLPHLTTHPALGVATAAALANVTEQAARAALNELAARGILRDATPTENQRPGRPRRWWVAGELLDLLAR